MAKKTFETSREIEFFAINQLVLSEINPRQDVNDDEVKDLAESINTCGLIQNLSGIKLQDGKIGIVAGGRRLRALQVLSKKKGFNAFPIPVKIATNETEAQAWANAENIARQDLHPADEIRAYGRMSETGSPVSTIARAFAVTEAHVYKRLKLAELPSSILDALKAGKINLSIAEIFTRSTDAKRTEDALSAIERNEIKSEHQLKNYL
ncbi:ParB/RepB/Spo0J family partition protein, partial [Kiloniella laminariae]|uniref:ParB/RepB/Spo0J family partition protein n=1 Tax=Kiloniella laminariae TaxID=454162 RepID=UPI000379FABF